MNDASKKEAQAWLGSVLVHAAVFLNIHTYRLFCLIQNLNYNLMFSFHLFPYLVKE